LGLKKIFYSGTSYSGIGRRTLCKAGLAFAAGGILAKLSADLTPYANAVEKAASLRRSGKDIYIFPRKMLERK
jgi:hypothetical protein